MEIKNTGLLIFGIIFLIIGLIAYFYRGEYPWYPYQTLGIILSIAGIIFIVLAFLYPLRRTLPPPP